MKPRFLLTAAVLLAACQTQDATDTTAPVPSARLDPAEAPHHHPRAHPARPGDRLPVAQLALVRRATARYHDVKNAVADGYRDINVLLPNMGRHFLRDTLVDGRFEVERPELLVYSPDPAGRLRLVAVEYAIPLSLSATAPAGFIGTADEWFADQRFHLWTLHAWVWKENPDGVFNPTNSQVP